ncbi:MAG: hypothetical protein R3F20_05640 [Planctomycetota bacterium]
MSADPGLFRGAVRSVPAAAGLVGRELLRGRTFVGLLVVYLLHLSVHRAQLGLPPGVAAARFLDHAFTGLTVLLVFAALVFGLAPAAGSREESPAAGSALGRRLAGDAAWYWGRAIGLAGVLVALAFGFALLAGTHFAARFGGFDAQPVRRQVESDSFVRGRKVRHLQKVGDRLRFALERPTGPVVHGEARVEIRLAPQLAIFREGGATRASYPVRWRLEEPGGRFRAEGVVGFREGKAARIRTLYRGSARPDSLVLELEKIDPEYVVGFRREGVRALAEPRSLPASLLEGALVAALQAAAFGGIAIFCARRFGRATAWIAAGGLSILAASFDALEYGPLAALGPQARDFVVSTLRFLVPDLGACDPADWLAAGRAVTLAPVGATGLRLVVTVFLLGFVAGVLARRRAS